MGPAGSGKSTYIKRMMEHFDIIKRTVVAVNLDPAVDELPYVATVDIRSAIDIQAVMEEKGFGPNGGLIYCLESIVQNQQWFDEEIGEHEDDYLLIDLPGQIELFTHLDIMPRLFRILQEKGYHIIGIFLLDSQFMVDPSKFLSGCLAAISAITIIEIPHICLMSKCDLLSEDMRQKIDEFCDMNTTALYGAVATNPRLEHLTAKICELIEQFNLLQFIPFNPLDDEEVVRVVAQIDLITQYYDNNTYIDFNEEKF
ncbi:ATP binding protein [Histomonas meleagridis]|uniref:ATP binding protein n=1 Tax=Histomonas meleagridis TaxID=135588 RepID=UPI00355A04AA|nr:ATP binding protein [Histomonas meleagridis]KAH0803592.1 ATP binding protein [Histomonas meleagridis]